MSLYLVPSSNTSVSTKPTPLPLESFCIRFSADSFSSRGDINGMAVVRAAAIFAVIACILVPYAQAQATAPAPAPASDGTSIDQGIAYLLMLVALVLTYLIH